MAMVVSFLELARLTITIMGSASSLSFSEGLTRMRVARRSHIQLSGHLWTFFFFFFLFFPSTGFSQFFPDGEAETLSEKSEKADKDREESTLSYK